MSEIYTTVLADPAWEYEQQLKMSDGVKRSSASQYETMSVQAVCDLYTPSVMEGDNRRGVPNRLRPGILAGFEITTGPSFLFLWITGPMLLEGMHMRVCNAWGYTPKQIIPWIKGRMVAEHGFTTCLPKLVLNIGMGAITRGVSEFLIVAARGKYTSLVTSHAQPGLIVAEEDTVILEQRRSHSTKPEAQYALIERVCPGPYLELFARRRRPGWTSWGKALTAEDIATARVDHSRRGFDVESPADVGPAVAASADVDTDVDNSDELIEWP